MLAYTNRIDEAISQIEQSSREDTGNVLYKLGLILKYALKGDKARMLHEMTPGFQRTILRDAMFSHYLAGFLSLLGEKEKALDWLENAVHVGFINYPLLNEYDPFLANVRGAARFKKLMERVKYEWENFEV